MARNIFAGGGVQTFMGDNNPLYVQNMNSLKAAFTDLQNDISGAGNPIGTIIMWGGDPAAIPTEVPAGYAVCNGASLVKNDYLDLWNVIKYRYGGSGANFTLPNLTTRVPQGTIGAPTVPTTKVTSVSSNVDVHTHTVNSSFTAGNAASHTHSGGVFTQGNADTHTHSGATVSGANSNIGLTVGNAAAHTHSIVGNTGGQSSQHSHSYTKPNSGNNANTGGYNTDHTHGILFNSQNANATGLNTALTGANSNIGVNAQGAPNAVLGMSVSAPGAPNTTIAVNSSFTAGNATTINASTLSHTHNFAITELVFIIRVS